MKKFIYLFLAISILSSCQSDNDDEGSNGGDPIIGKWQLTSETESGKEISDECQRKTTITFLENGTTDEVYYYNNGNNVCDSDTESATWENIGNSNYKVSYNGGNDSKTNKVSFSDNNRVFSVTFTEEYNGNTFVYVGTYKKI